MLTSRRCRSIHHKHTLWLFVNVGKMIPLAQSAPWNPGKQWQTPDTHSPFPWQLRGQSCTESEMQAPRAHQLIPIQATNSLLSFSSVYFAFIFRRTIPNNINTIKLRWSRKVQSFTAARVKCKDPVIYWSHILKSLSTIRPPSLLTVFKSSVPAGRQDCLLRPL